MLDLPNWYTFGYTSKKGTPYIFCSRMIFLYTDAFVDLALLYNKHLSKSTPKSFIDCTLSTTLSFICNVGRISKRLSVWLGLWNRQSFVFSVLSESLLDMDHSWTLINPLCTVKNNVFKYLSAKINLYHLQTWLYQGFPSNSGDHLHVAKKIRDCKLDPYHTPLVILSKSVVTGLLLQYIVLRFADSSETRRNFSF